MILEQMEVGSMSNFVYIGGDPSTRDGFVVDPAFEPEKILGAAQKLGLSVNRIFLTHHHHDHVNAAMMVKAKTGAKILAHEATERLLKGSVTIDDLLADGDTVTLEGNQAITILHTPGHSPGGICLVVDGKWLITGDTLFIGNCGRTDLQGGDPKKLFESLSRLKQLPDPLIIFSGHDYGPAPARTLGEEKRLNPALIARSLEEFNAVP